MASPVHSAHKEAAEEHPPVSATRLVTSLLDGERKEIVVVLIYGLGVGLLSLAVPIGVQNLVNTVTFGTLNQTVVFLILAVFFGLGCAAILRAIQITVVEELQKRFFAKIALELAYRLPRLEASGRYRAHIPELVNRFFDVLTVQKASASLLLEGFALALQIAVGLVLLAFYHWFLLAFAIVLVAAVALVLLFFGKGGVATSIQESIEKYRVAAWLEEVAARPNLFRSIEARRLAMQRADEVVSAYLRARSDHFAILMRQVGGSLALQALGSSALLGIGAFLVIENKLTLGQLVAAEIVVTTALGSLAKFQKHLESYYDLVAALDKIHGLLLLPLERASGGDFPSRQGPLALELRNVSFSYENGAHVFENLSFSAPQNARVALLGENASGKTTLIDLLYGLKTPRSGAVLVDGIDGRELTPEALRGRVALVRGLELLPDTIFENVRLGRDSVDAEKVREALRRVGLMDAILQLPDGIQTKLGADGSPLTVAQSQTLTIARAIVGEPGLLLVDETLDELDEEARKRALEVLLDPSSPWTLVLATHSESLARKFREIVSLDAIRTGGKHAPSKH